VSANFTNLIDTDSTPAIKRCGLVVGDARLVSGRP
jgi:hypothetical protein